MAGAWGYCIDTSSVLRIAKLDYADRIWTGLFELAEQGRLVTAKYVLRETKKWNGDAYEKLVDLPTLAVVPDTDPNIMPLAGLMTLRYPRMAKPWSKRDVADPWVVAVGLARSLTVVCDERIDAPPQQQRMPYVCEQEGVRCINSGQLIRDECMTLAR